MNRPKLFPENPVSSQNTQRFTTIGIIAYTLYFIPLALGGLVFLGSIAFDPPKGISSATNQAALIGGIILIITIDILLPLRLLRKTYNNGLTRFRSLTTLIFPTLTGMRIIYFAPLAIYNILLVAYFYHQIKTADPDTDTNTNTNTKSTTDQKSPSPQRIADDLEENSYNPNDKHSE